jgi:pimeloyl-ACP methyl ester carboxylesterase
MRFPGIIQLLPMVIVLSGNLFAQERSQNPPKMQLETCRLNGWAEDVRCGRYEVYENRRTRSGRKIALKIVVLPAVRQKPAADPIFYFAGGPGGSSTETIARAGKTYLAGLRADRDLVFVDQRGTGGSNQLACTLYPDKNDMSAYFSEVIPLERLRACKAELEKNADLRLYSTSIAMDDLDEVRVALGYDQINLYGGSYGSTAALAYLRQYPQHVRAVTILGVAPPDAPLPLPVIKGVQNALERTFADCAADQRCHAAFPDPKRDLEAAIKVLEKGPATFQALNPFTRQQQTVKLTRPVFGELVRTILYQPESARWLPLLLHQAAESDFSLFASVSFQTFRAIEDQIARGMHFSVVCGEDVPFITDAALAREKAGLFYGDGRVQVYRKVCEFWPRAEVPATAVTAVRSDKPVLLISGEADPVAPSWLAAEAARQLPNGRHVIIPHTGHYFQFPCVDKLVTEFVSKGSAKELDTACVAEIHAPPFVTEEMLRAVGKSQPPAANEEVWQGVLEVSGTRLRLILHVSKATDGRLTGSLDSPDQGDAKGLPVDTLTMKDGALHFEMNLIGGVYDGKVTSDGGEIRGEWKQGALTLPLTFKRTAK